MREFFLKLQDNFVKLKPQHKLIIGVVLLLIISTFFIVFYMVSRTEYGILYSNINEKEAGAILAEIDKIPEFKGKAKLMDGGTRIDVPILDRAKIKIALAQADALPKGNLGWDIFDQKSMTGTTKMEFDIKKKRALIGELEKTLRSYEKVESAKVNVTIAPDAVFAEDQKETRASITLSLKPLNTLTPQEVKGMRKVIAHSVLGLIEKNIVIQDTTGKVWSDLLDGEDSEVGMINKHAQMRRSEEYEIKRKIKPLLENICGMGKVLVEVAVDMNFDAKEETRKIVTAPITTEDGEKKSLVVSENELLEQYTGNSINPVGVPGTTTNIPGYKETDKNASNYKRVEGTRNYAHNEKQETINYAAGIIKKITVSVFVNETMEVFKKRHGQNIVANLTTAVKNSIGFDETRKDSVAIFAAPFNDEYIKSQRRELQLREARKRFIWYSILIFVLVLSIAFGISYYIKKEKERRAEELKKKLMDQQLLADEMAFEPVLSPEEQEKQEKQDRIKQFAKDRPDDVVSLLRIWMAQE